MNKKSILLDIFKIATIFLVIFSTILLRPVSDMDELWNYNFARNVANGLLPYKDFNMVQMPLLPFICAIFLKLIANELIVMRILAATLCTAIIFLIYKIFNLLEIDEKVSFLLSMCITFLSIDVFCIDYNWTTLLVVLLIVYIEIKNLKKDKYEQLIPKLKIDFLIGILSGLTILLKQTTGIVICTVALGYKLLFVKNRESFKKYLKIFNYRIMAQIIVVSVLMVYLIVSNSLKEWFEYTVLGIKYFDNSIPYSNLFKNDNYVISILSVLLPINFIYLCIKTILKKRLNNSDKNLLIIFVYGLSTFILVYPIADMIHFIIGGMLSILSMLYIVNILLSKLKLDAILFKVKEFTLYMLLPVVILCSAWYSIKNIDRYLKNENKSQLKHFNYISIDTNLENEINEVDKFIINQEVDETKTIILDAYACIYMIPIDKYNKDYDMLLKGNLGNNETQKLIDNINSQNKLNILIRNKGNLNWQTPIGIIDYFKENLQSQGEVGCFKILYKE